MAERKHSVKVVKRVTAMAAGGVKAGAARLLEWRAMASGSTPGAGRFVLARRLAMRGLLPVLGSRADDAYIVASELLTNAVKETAGEEIRFLATFDRRSLWIGVWDSSDAVPEEPPLMPQISLDDLDALPDEFVENGRGLAVIQGLADERGVIRTVPCGKWVWAAFRYPRAG